MHEIGHVYLSNSHSHNSRNYKGIDFTYKVNILSYCVSISSAIHVQWTRNHDKSIDLVMYLLLSERTRTLYCTRGFVYNIFLFSLDIMNVTY